MVFLFSRRERADGDGKCVTVLARMEFFPRSLRSSIRIRTALHLGPGVHICCERIPVFLRDGGPESGGPVALVADTGTATNPADMVLARATTPTAGLGVERDSERVTFRKRLD